MKKTIVLNGVTFEVHEAKEDALDFIQEYAGRTLDQCYANPSYSKKYIYKMWEEWAYLNDVQCFGVRSYNGFMFTLQGVVSHVGHRYILHITKSANKAYLIW